MATNWILSRRKYALASETDAIVDLFVGGLAGPRENREMKTLHSHNAAEY
jgi:hypothetical protein